MSQISRSEAMDLMEKLLTEQIPLLAFLRTPTGLRIRARGFIESATRAVRVAVCTTLPAAGDADAYVMVPLFRDGVERPCEYTYGEKRELDPVIAEMLTGDPEDSVLTIRFADSGETFCLFFTL